MARVSVDAERCEALYDELEGEPLPADLVRTSRREEVEVIEGRGCWGRLGQEEAWRLGGKRPLRTRWVDVNRETRRNPTFVVG